MHSQKEHDGESYLTRLGGLVAELDPNSSIYNGTNEGADSYERQAEVVARHVLRDVIRDLNAIGGFRNAAGRIAFPSVLVYGFARERGIDLEAVSS